MTFLLFLYDNVWTVIAGGLVLLGVWGYIASRKENKKIQQSACPSCHKVVGWHDLPLKQSSKYEYEGEKSLDLLGLVSGLVDGSVLTECRYKECPLCGYREEVKE